MVSRDLIAQWRQDITTADDAGDEATARRLRGELASALDGSADRSAATVGGDEAGRHTGTKDKDYDLIWFVETCLRSALRMEHFAHEADRAGDAEKAEFFRRAQHESRKGAEQGKVLLRRRLIGDAANTTPEPLTNP